VAYNDTGLASVHISAALTQVAIEYNAQNFIADMIFPRVPVEKENDKYWVFDKSGMRTGDVTGYTREQGTETIRVIPTQSDESYACVEHALESPIDARLSKEADFDLGSARVRNLMDRLMRDREKRIADQLFSTTNITQNTTLTSTDQWSDYTNSDPIGDIETGTTTVEKATGYTPNTLVLGREVYLSLKRHPALLELINVTDGAVPNALMMELFDVERILVGRGVRNTVAEDTSQTHTGGYIWGKYALLGYVPPSPSIAEPSLGYQFVSRDWQVDQYEEPRISSRVHKVSEISDNKITAAGCGYLIAGAIA